jgi:hypothetical protein
LKYSPPELKEIKPMKTKIIISLGLASMLLWNCGNQSDIKKMASNDLTIQQDDGTVSLRLADAGRYNDVTDPKNNTAEWNVVFSKAGGYKVWISSATKDTVNLKYSTSVKVNLPDSQLAAIPECDKIIHNSTDVTYPYFRADSFMGSIYISEPGEYNIQVISDKVMPKDSENQAASISDESKLVAVIISPEITR